MSSQQYEIQGVISNPSESSHSQSDKDKNKKRGGPGRPPKDQNAKPTEKKRNKKAEAKATPISRTSSIIAKICFVPIETDEKTVVIT